MSVLVTGATGFLGSRLAAELVSRGFGVRVLHRPGSDLAALAGLDLECAVGDILDAGAVAAAVRGCTRVFHVAALSAYWRAQPEQVLRVNVEGTRTVMAACLQEGVARVVYTSSVAAIGRRPNGQPADEDTPFDARDTGFAYGYSKHLAEKAVRDAVAQGLAAVIVNPTVVIGPGDHNMISGSIIVELARRSLPAVPPGGVCVADVDAVVAGHIAAADCGRVGERYILGGENLTYRELAATVAEISGRIAPRRAIPPRLLEPMAGAVDALRRVSGRPSVVSGDQIRLSEHNLFFSSDKAVRELAYPLLPFRPAAERAYRWYHEHGYV